MINKTVSYLLMLFLFMNLSSCLKSSVDDQVKLEAGVIGALEVSGNFNRGVSPVNTIDSFFITLKNNGKLSIKILNFHLDSPKAVNFIDGKYPGLNGTCAEELKANESCVLSFQVFGNKTIEYSDGFWIDYLNGVKEQRFHGNINGAFGEPAKVEFVGSLFHDFGLLEPGVEKKIIFTLRNNGELPAKNIQGFIASAEEGPESFYFTGSTKKFPGQNGNCKEVLNYLESCTIEVATKPLTTGSVFKSNVAVTYMNPISSQTINAGLQVEAADFKAYLSILEKSQNLGNILNGVSLGASPEVAFTLVNNGYVPATNIKLINTNSLPLIFKSSTCEGVLPGISCQMVFAVQSNYSTQLPSPTNFPIQYFEKNVSFSYNDGKFSTLAYTEDVVLSLKILGEGYLNIYKNGDVSTPFNINHNLLTNSVTWSRADWITSIGSSSISQHEIKLANGKAGATVDATNISYQVIGPDGEIKVRCKEDSSCMNKLGGGGSTNTFIDHYPIYTEPFIEDIDYTLRISYFSGLETKTTDIKIETKKIANPIIKISKLGFSNDLANNYELEKTTGNRNVEDIFVVKNSGPLPYTFDLDNTELVNAPYFSIPDATNECKNVTIKNGQTCKFKVSFLKSSYEGTYPDPESHILKLKFTNGLASTNANFVRFEKNIQALVLSPRRYVNNPSAVINFQSKPWSSPGKSDKVFNQVVKVVREGGWKISQAVMTLEGADKNYFAITSGELLLKDETTGGNSVSIDIGIMMISPNDNLPTPHVLNAKLVIKYYGKKEEDFTGFSPEDKIEIPIIGTIKNEPYAVITQKIPFPQTKINETSYGVVTVENTGQVNLTGTNQLEILLTELNPQFFKYDIASSLTTCSNISVTTQPSNPTSASLLVKHDLLVGERCDIALSFTPQTSGNKYTTLVLNYKYSSGEDAFSSQLSLIGAGAIPGTVDISPIYDSFIQDFFSFGNSTLGTPKTLPFSISNKSGNFGNSIIIDGISMVEMTSGGNCRFASKLPVAWKDYIQVSSASDYTLANNNCLNKRIANVVTVSEGQTAPPLDGDESCNLEIIFNASIPNRLIGSCLEVSYRSVESSTVNRKYSMKVLGYGVPPIADFNGWIKIISFGETDNSLSENTLEWKPMTVALPSVTVVGYNVYRKLASDLSYPTSAVNRTLISIANAEGNFYYNDIHEDETNILDEFSIFNYEIRAVVKFTGLSGEYELATNGVDKTVRIVQAPAYTVFFPRIFLNKLVCVDQLGLSYSALNRSNNYNCTYTGYGNTGGLFDFGKSILVDMYENSFVEGKPSNLPGYQPRLYNNLSDAKASCSLQKVDIPKLSLLNVSKRLINRQEYMITSSGQKTIGCNVENATLSYAGDNTNCISTFRIENLIGNAWDFLDAQITKASSGDKWNYSDNIFTGSRVYPLSVRALNFDSIAFNDYTTYYQFSTFNDSLKCYHPMQGVPLSDVAGSCPGGSILTSIYKSKMNLNTDYNHIQTIDDSSHIFASEEGFRLLFAGGSYKSKPVFGIEPNRHTMYWTNPYVETILSQGAADQRARWEGGAARCVLDISN